MKRLVIETDEKSCFQADMRFRIVFECWVDMLRLVVYRYVDGDWENPGASDQGARTGCQTVQ